MIMCNLAVLLAERGLRVSQVSRDTGISRTTITGLMQNMTTGINFDTVDTLCLYLNVTPSDLMKVHPVAFEIVNITPSADYITIEKGRRYEGGFSIRIKDNKKIYIVPFKMVLEGTVLEEHPGLFWVETSFQDTNSYEADVFRKYYAELPVPFKTRLKTELFVEIRDSTPDGVFIERLGHNDFDEVVQK